MNNHVIIYKPRATGKSEKCEIIQSQIETINSKLKRGLISLNEYHEQIDELYQQHKSLLNFILNKPL